MGVGSTKRIENLTFVEIIQIRLFHVDFEGFTIFCFDHAFDIGPESGR